MELSEEITHASDIYSLGVVLYEAVTGRHPFDGPAPAAVALERLGVRPAPPSAVAPNLPDGIDQLIMRALERDPADRSRRGSDAGPRPAESADRWPRGRRHHGRRNHRPAPAGLAASASGAIAR